MPDNLKIEKIEFSSLKLDPDKKEEYVDVDIMVKNPSNEKAFAISEVRRIHYDSGSDTLILGLTDDEILQEPPSDIKMIIHRMLPPTVMVPPGESKVIKVSVPIVMNRLVLPPPGSEKIKVDSSNISGLKHVLTKVSFGTSPLNTKPESGEQTLKRMRTWGRTIEKKFDLQLPGRHY